MNPRVIKTVIVRRVRTKNTKIVSFQKIMRMRIVKKLFVRPSLSIRRLGKTLCCAVYVIPAGAGFYSWSLSELAFKLRAFLQDD